MNSCTHMHTHAAHPPTPHNKPCAQSLAFPLHVFGCKAHGRASQLCWPRRSGHACDSGGGVSGITHIRHRAAPRTRTGGRGAEPLGFMLSSCYCHAQGSYYGSNPTMTVPFPSEATAAAAAARPSGTRELARERVWSGEPHGRSPVPVPVRPSIVVRRSRRPHAIPGWKRVAWKRHTTASARRASSLSTWPCRASRWP